MGFTKYASEIWRDYETDDVPASGPHNPVKADIRSWAAVFETRFGGAPRELLTADRTYYVNASSGDDGNDGLTAGTAVATIQAAYDIVSRAIDMAGFNIVIQVADGTYTDGVNCDRAVTGGGSPATVQFLGNATNPENCVISTTNKSCFSAGAGVNSLSGIFVDGFTLETTGSGNCLEAYGGGVGIIWGNIRFGNCAGDHIHAGHSCFIISTGNYSIVGNASSHISAATNCIVAPHGATITFENSPAFDQFVGAVSGAGVFFADMTFVNGNTVTGRKFSIVGGFISTGGNGRGVDYLPGSLAGYVRGGGQYDTLVIDSDLALVSANYSVTEYDGDILVDATSGAITITLHAVDAYTSSFKHSIVKIDGGANAVTIVPQSGGSINGGSSKVLSAANEAVRLRSYGANWFSIT